MKVVVAENLLLKQQLLVLTRSRKRAPNLSSVDRFFLGLWSTFFNPRCIRRVAVLVQPSTRLKFHQAMVKRKYQWLYSSPNRKKPGPKGPSRELIKLVLDKLVEIGKAAADWIEDTHFGRGFDIE